MIYVIGAGIVGCASAYQLARAGHPVTLVDAASGPGQGCSLANGAQLSYSYVEPLASPATLRALPHLLLHHDSPVRFQPTADWRQYAWGLQFLAACTDAQVRRATLQLLILSALSRDTLSKWMRDGLAAPTFRQNGKLVLCPDDATLQRQRRQMEYQAMLGCEQHMLNVDDCVEREPALLDAVRRNPKAWTGGVWTPSEGVVDAHALCIALVRRLCALGGQTKFDTHVTGFVRQRDRVSALITTSGEVPCQTVVIAAGVQSVWLAKGLSEYLPVYPIRGYSITLPLRCEPAVPVVSVTDLGRKTVFAPVGSHLRVAASAEIGGYDLALPTARTLQMRTAALALYPKQVDLHAAGRPWVGLRPATPTSIPIIRRSHRYANAYFNAGHGGLGLTLAAGSAATLESVVRHQAR